MNKTGRRILVVDDDPDIGTMLRIMLEYKGYAVMVSDRAENLVETIQDGGIELIIMDMLLSGKNGIDICSGLKHNPISSHIPVIMISAHPNAKEVCFRSGADDFISKPFDMHDLLTKISRLVEPLVESEK